MSKFAERFQKDWVYHLLIWLVLIVPQTVGSTYIMEKSVPLFWWNTLVKDATVLLIIYGNFSILIPLFYKKRKVALYILGFLVLLAIHLLQSYYWGRYMAQQLKYDDYFWS